MAMSKGVGVGSIVVGCSLLVLTLISVICGAVAVTKISAEAGAGVGLWSLYFLIPGVLSILAGFKRLQSLLGVALGAHILGIILAIVGFVYAVVLWAVLSAVTCFGSPFRDSTYCSCTLSSGSDSKVYTFKASCEDLDTIRSATAAVTIIYAIIAIVSLVGSIYGCIGTCCAPREPTVVVTAGRQPTTVVMTTNTPGYNPQQPPPYTGQGQVGFNKA